MCPIFINSRILLLLLLGGNHVVAPDCETVDRSWESLDMEFIAQTTLQLLLELERRVSHTLEGKGKEERQEERETYLIKLIIRHHVILGPLEYGRGDIVDIFDIGLNEE